MDISTVFERFAGLSLEPGARPFDELDNLAEQRGWSGKTLAKKRRQLCMLAWEEKCPTKLGDLERLQKVCLDLGLGHMSSKNKCIKAIKSTHVNIYDYLEGHPKQFPSRNALAAYSRNNGRIYPLKAAKGDVVLRAMLEPLGR